MLLRQLVRQLKILNIWVTIFGTLMLVTLIALGILVFKMVLFVHSTEAKIADIQQKTSQTLDVQTHICNSDGLGSILSKTTDYCK